MPTPGIDKAARDYQAANPLVGDNNELSAVLSHAVVDAYGKVVLDAEAIRRGDASPLLSQPVVQTPIRNIALADVGKYVVFTNSVNGNVEVPLQASVPFPDGAEITIERGGAGEVFLQGAGGVTLRVPASKGPYPLEQYSVIKLKRISTNMWTVFGDLGTGV